MNARNMLVAVTVVAFMAAGCGQKREGEITSGVASTPGPVALAGHSSPELATVAETANGVEPVQNTGGLEQGTVDAAAAESLPPEIDATVTDTPVEPGTVIEISAVGSSDVTEMVLRDALGKTYPLTRNEETGTWRVFYRVPMKITGDRPALSVTARNGVNQWRRVWVFPTVMREEAVSDSSGC